jgi:hypothetical protein
LAKCISNGTTSTRGGQEGVCPLDAELSLPPRCYSDLLRDWAEYCITDESYNESIRVLKRILGLSGGILALERAVQDDAADVEAFYEQKDMPPPKTEGPILVAQADGKGVPMMRDEPAARPARRSKGQKRTKKKEAVGTAIYAIEPYQRTPQEVVEALLRDLAGDEGAEPTSTSRPQRPASIGKEGESYLGGERHRLLPITQGLHSLFSSLSSRSPPPTHTSIPIAAQPQSDSGACTNSERLLSLT